MNRQAVCLSIFLTLVLLPSFGSQSQVDQHGRFNAPSKAAYWGKSGSLQRSASSRQSSVRSRAAASAQVMGSNPPISQIGFLGINRTGAGGATFSNFPAVLGDFTGSGKKLDVATVVNGGASSAISVALSNGDGTFTVKSTPTPNTDPNPDPIWVGDLNNDGKDDILLGHQATATATASVDVWLSKGDGTFTFNNNTAITTIAADNVVWATVADVNGDNKLDFVVADAANPGNIWTLNGKGNGTFGAPTPVAFTGQLSLKNPVVFADFSGDGILDFAGASATNNQIVVYLANGSGGYLAPVALATPDSVYDSCFLAGGQLATSTDLVSANCTDNTVTVYVNTGGTFSAGTYYPVSGTLLAPAEPVAVTIADVNGDGHNDIVATDQQGSDLTVLLGNGNGTVQDPSVGYALGGSPHTPAVVADFNQDGKNDVIVPDYIFNFAYLQGYGDGSFRSAMNYYAQPVPAGTGLLYSVGIASGDFNGDGIPDFVIGNGQTGKKVSGITVFLSNKDGSLQPGVRFGPTGGPTNYELEYVAVGDFDGDGNLDIAATDAFNGGVWIFSGDGHGNFTATSKTPYPTDTAGTLAFGVAAGDFNRDGKVDVAVINTNSSGTLADVGIVLNTSSGHGNFGFGIPTNLPLANVGSEITAADLGNKQLDLIVPLFGTNTTPGSSVAVFLGKGDGTFPIEKDLSLAKCVNGGPCQNPLSAAVGDVNGDGKPDLIVTVDGQNITQGVVVALGNGDGTFQTTLRLFPSSLQSPNLVGAPDPAGVKITDLNGDGHADVICTNSRFGTVSVLYGVGNGTFYDPLEFPAGHLPYDIALADVNGDGAVDVVASGNGQDFSGVTVLLNTSADSILPPTSSANPSQAGSPVTFTATVAGSKVRGVTAIPTGSVTFLDGSTSLGSSPLDSSGEATLVKGLVFGPHSITAQYSGDAHYLKATSSALIQGVKQSPDGTVLVSSANPAFPGQSVTFTATVASTLTGDTLVPTGHVTFSDGTSVLGSVPLNSSGTAALPPTSKLAAGLHSITAQYSGDTNFPQSKASLNQSVVQPDYSLKSDQPGPVNPGSSASYNITLTPIAGYDGTVTINCPSGLPPGVSCNTPINIPSGQTKATLTIKTAGPNGALIAAPNVNPHQGESNLWASLGGVGMIGMILAGDWKRRNRRRMAIVLLIVALAMILALVGCGSGGSSSGGGGGGGGTPANTYLIKVSATGTAGTHGGNTSPHSLLLTLKVL
ncbi:MAG TPA: FG-GAP-like repeat-containing protein [Terriglobales bacterium]|nr:FG-GAP-like repeat-containing protein [Terriglobales bacterium]